MKITLDVQYMPQARQVFVNYVWLITGKQVNTL